MRNVVRALRAQNATRFIVTLALSVATLFLGVPLAAAAGPTVLVAHRGVGTSTQIKYNLVEAITARVRLGGQEQSRHRRHGRTSHLRQPAGRDA